MERTSGIHIILSTGFYKEPFLPEFVHTQTPEELAGLVESEILEGIGDTGLHASVIGEFGTSKESDDPDGGKGLCGNEFMAASRRAYR